jgi:hypothetical protein
VLQERERAFMARLSLEIVRIEIHEHLHRIYQLRCEHAEAVAATRKSIDESRALMVEVDAVMAKR